MQLVVLSAVMMEAMMLPMIWRMVFHVSLFFMVSDVFLGFVTWREPLMYDVRWLKADSLPLTLSIFHQTSDINHHDAPSVCLVIDLSLFDAIA